MCHALPPLRYLFMLLLTTMTMDVYIQDKSKSFIATMLIMVYFILLDMYYPIA